MVGKNWQSRPWESNPDSPLYERGLTPICHCRKSLENTGISSILATPSRICKHVRAIAKSAEETRYSRRVGIPKTVTTVFARRSAAAMPGPLRGFAPAASRGIQTTDCRPEGIRTPQSQPEPWECILDAPAPHALLIELGSVSIPVWLIPRQAHRRGGGWSEPSCDASAVRGTGFLSLRASGQSP